MKTVFTLLVVDDEPNITFSLKHSLASEELRIITASTGREGIEYARTHRPHAVLLDVRLPDMSGLEAYEKMREFDQRLPVIIMTAFARTETAIEATRRGAFDYLVKPVDLKRLRDVVGKALEVSRLGRVPAVMGEEEETLGDGADVIVGLSSKMQEVYKTIGRVAAEDAAVLILGESGTGKELVARAIYHYSRRQAAPFLAINCAALPEALLESELFGHERGAFTGADQRRIGKFEQVHGGTILLDEIGDMSPATQAKALRLLQQQQFERLGGNTTIQTDVRVIAATNRNIEAMVENGSFRRDLYYRLNVFTIQLPALRERREDIPQLARHFIRRLAASTGHQVHSITPDAVAQLEAHDWPGNVREFESAMRFAVVHATSDVVTIDCLPDSCRVRPKLFSAMNVASEAHAKPVDEGAEAPAIAVLSTVNPYSERTADFTALKSTQVVPQTTLALPPPPAKVITNHVANAPAFDLSALAQQMLDERVPNLYRQLGSAVDKVVLEIVMKHAAGNQLYAAELLGISRMTLRSKLRTLAASSNAANKSAAQEVEDVD